MISAILDWIYPPTCIACRNLLPLNAPSRYVCDICKDLFDPIAAPVCAQCGRPMESETDVCASCFGKNYYFAASHVTFLYDDLIRDLMHEIKFRQKKRIAKGLAELWGETITRDGLPCDATNAIFVPLPMHPKKQRERGFNQAEILAHALSRVTNIPMENALARTQDTPPQSGLHPRQRMENVHGIFSITHGHDPSGRSYILVDDIYTTGASLNECARTLMDAGAARVVGLILAIAMKKDEPKITD